MPPEHWLFTIRLRLRSLFRWAQADQELDDELLDHLERRIEEYVAQGMTQEEAHRRARLDLGGIEQTKEKCREARRVNRIQDFVQDLHFGLRMLRKNPGFSLVAMMTLALGISSSTVVFSVFRGVLVESVPFRDPSRLVAVLDVKRLQGLDWQYVSRQRFEELRRTDIFEQIAAAVSGFVPLGDGRAQHFVPTETVSSEFFAMLGVAPILGRVFTPDEERPGHDAVALLSYRTWRDQFGSDPSIVGKTIARTPSYAGRVVIGVLPPAFQFINGDIGVWTPLLNDPASPYREVHLYMVLARLRPGITAQRAQAVLDGVAAQLVRQYPAASAGWGFTLRDFRKFYTGRDNVGTTLKLLLAAVGLLLLTACSNLANLLLARSVVRRKEMALRLAIGASRSRVVAQLFTESLILGLAGGAAGFLLARAVFSSVIQLAPAIPTFRPDALRLDWSILAFAMVISIVATMVFSLIPAFHISRVDCNRGLRESGRGVQGSRRDRTGRNFLVATEIALAMVLLCGATLVAASFRRLESDNLGFNPDHVLTMWNCCLDPAQYPEQRDIATYFNRVFARLRDVTGVQDASASSRLPLRQINGISSQFEIRDGPRDPQSVPVADLYFVESDYFATMQIRLVHGRYFDRRDTADSPPVCLINQSMARRFWLDRDPVGEEMRPQTGDGSGRWHRIVGIVADAKQRGLGTDSRPTYYLNFYQQPVRYAYFVIRTRPSALSLANAAKDAIWSVDPTIPIEDVRTMEEAMGSAITTQRFSTLLASLFAALALGLAALGVYGVTGYAVAQRKQEIGIRMSLGASRGAILALILRETALVSGSGIVCGFLMALAFSRFLQGLLYGIGATDVQWLAIAGIFLSLVALAACFIPARRAMKVDPMVALRYE